MAAQRGKDLLLKLDIQGNGNFTTVAGLRSKTLAFNATPVDVTSADSFGQWRELLAGAGIRRASVTGTGLFRDAASDAAVRALFFGGEIAGWQVTIPDFGLVEGQFQIAALEFAGRHDAEVTYDIALESAGALIFEAL